MTLLSLIFEFVLQNCQLFGITGKSPGFYQNLLVSRIFSDLPDLALSPRFLKSSF